MFHLYFSPLSVRVCRKTNTSTMSCEILFRIWPYSTLLINTTACFLFGIIVEIRDKRKEMLPHGLEEILLIGLFGGYSTLSTFAFQVYDMFVCQRYLLAIGYIIVTNAIAILAVWAGVVLIRFVLSESVQAPSSPSEVSPGTLRSRWLLWVF